MSRPVTLGQLRESGWESVPVKEEIRRNAIRRIATGERLFEGVIGYDETVLPQLENALLAGHDVIFLGERNELIIEDHTNGSYTRIDQPTLDQLAEQVNAAMAQLEQMLDGMPAAQREMVLQMQQQAGMSIPGLGAAEAPVLEVRASGRSDTRAGYPVREWELLEDGVVERRMWVTPWSEIDGGDEAREALTGMATFFDAFLAAMPSLPGVATIQNPFTSIDEMGGMPVVTEELRSDGSVERTSEVTGVERRTLGASTFEPSPELTERPLPTMGGG